MCMPTTYAGEYTRTTNLYNLPMKYAPRLARGREHGIGTSYCTAGSFFNVPGITES